MVIVTRTELLVMGFSVGDILMMVMDGDIEVIDYRDGENIYRVQ